MHTLARWPALYSAGFLLSPTASSISLLGKRRLESLKDLDLNAGLGLLGLGRRRAKHLVGLGETGTDVLRSESPQTAPHLHGELVERVGLDGVDGQGVVAVHGSKAGGGWG